MIESRPLLISRAEFLQAFRDQTPDNEWWLDRQTGELIFVSPEVAPEDEHELDVEALKRDEPQRLLAIAPVSSRDAYRLMQQFIAQLDDDNIAEMLSDAIGQKRAFFQFQDRLHDVPGMREQWLAAEQQGLTALAEQWLAQQGIAVDWRP